MRRLAILAGSFLLLLVASPSAQTGYDLFQQALVKERADAKPIEAIRLYQKVVDQAGDDRALAAKALVQMARCYEKLGNPEAQRTYTRLIAQFSDQPEPFAIARAALARGGSTQPDAERRPELPTCNPSPDGNYCAIWSDDDDLEVQAIATSQRIKVTSGSNLCAWQWSADSKRMMYAWCTEEKEKPYFELRVVNRDGTGTRVTVPRTEGRFESADWTLDERRAVIQLNSGSNHVTRIVSFADHAVRDFPARPSPLNMFTGDGQYLFYSVVDSNSRKFFSVNASTDQEQVLFEGSAETKALGWTPSRRSFLFLSDRAGTWDIWMVPIANGRPVGFPALIKRDVGPIQSSGPTHITCCTDAGALFYRFDPLSANAGNGDVYVVQLNATTGKVSSEPALVRQSVGHSAFPVWSGDGRLAFKSGPSGPAWPTISIVSIDSGVERTIRPSINVGPKFDWSPDGRDFLQFGSAIGKQRATFLQLYRVNADTGAVSLLATRQPGDLASIPKWFPDGKSVAYKLNRSEQIVLRDLETDQERVIVDTAGAFVVDYEFSPDGSAVAFLAARDQQGTRADIRVKSLSDGRTRTLVEYHDHLVNSDRCGGRGSDCGDIAWSSDGKYLVYYDRTADTLVSGATFRQAELWRIPVAGGPPEKLGLTLDNFWSLALSPDGRHLAFAQTRDISGVRVFEHFLPPSELGATDLPVGGRR